MRHLLLTAAATLALAACTTVGPDYEAPQAAPTAQGEFVSTASPLFSGNQPPGRWWSLFNDPVLDRLVEQALGANTDLRVAAANLAEARAVLREVRGGRLPSTTVSGSATYGRQSGSAAGLDEALPEGEVYDAGLDVGYQLDLFGRIRRAIQASEADVGAVQAAFDLTRISVAAETARAYADACSAGRQIEVAERTLDIQDRTFDLTRRLFEGGRGTALETSQAAALTEQTRAGIPVLEGIRRSALYRLAVLTGRPPAEFPAEVAACSTPPALTAPIPVGDGASLLARRPDIRAAERRLAAATARIGVETAALYPDVAIGASIGSTATSIGDLVSDEGFRFGIGPLISWSFPNTTTARARIAQAEAAADAALAEFDGTWLGALEETESALTRYAALVEQVQSLRRAQAQGNEAARIARLRYEAGRESFQIVLEVERSLRNIEAELAQAEANLSDSLVTLFLALGGGWEEGAVPAA